MEVYTIKNNLEETLDLEQCEFLLKHWVAFILTTALASLATGTLHKKKPTPGCGAPSTHSMVTAGKMQMVPPFKGHVAISSALPFELAIPHTGRYPGKITTKYSYTGALFITIPK